MRINLPELGIINISILNPYLLEFTKRQLGEYIVIDEGNAYFDCNWYVALEISNANVFKKIRELSQKNYTLSRDFHIESGEIYYAYMCIETGGNSIKIKMRKRSLGVKEKIRNVYSWIERADYGKWHGQFYQYVLFPVFLLYAIAGGYYLIHGSALQYEGKNLLLTGLDGVGKSSLTSILSEHDFHVLADNFLLFDGKKILPLNMPIRGDLGLKHGKDIKCIYKDKMLCEYISRTYLREEIIPDKFISLSIADELGFVHKSIDSFSYFMFVNHAPEINEANKFIGPFFFWHNQKATNINNELELLELGIPKGKLLEGAEAIINEVKKIH